MFPDDTIELGHFSFGVKPFIDPEVGAMSGITIYIRD